jgi:hypothetical protein
MGSNQHQAIERCRKEQQRCVKELDNPAHSVSTKWLVRLGLEDWLKEELRILAQHEDGAPVQMRLFETGATRNVDDNKLDYEGFLSPLVLKRYAEYMHTNRKQADGALRDSDNWQKGIPLPAYMKSLKRHVMDVWLSHRGYAAGEPLQVALCAVLFNAMGYLHTLLKDGRE